MEPAPPSLGERLVYGVVGAVLGSLLGLWTMFLHGVDWRLTVFLVAAPVSVAGFRWGARVLAVLKELFWQSI